MFGILPLPSPTDIDIKERLAALCAKVIAAPDRSEEFVCAMEELNSALSEHAENLRNQIASLRQKGFRIRAIPVSVESGGSRRLPLSQLFE